MNLAQTVNYFKHFDKFHLNVANFGAKLTSGYN